MKTNAEAEFWRHIHDVEGEQPDDFFYRVDSLMGVRTIRRDALLRPQALGHRGSASARGVAGRG